MVQTVTWVSGLPKEFAIWLVDKSVSVTWPLAVIVIDDSLLLNSEFEKRKVHKRQKNNKTTSSWIHRYRFMRTNTLKQFRRSFPPRRREIQMSVWKLQFSFNIWLSKDRKGCDSWGGDVPSPPAIKSLRERCKRSPTTWWFRTFYRLTKPAFGIDFVKCSWESEP